MPSKKGANREEDSVSRVVREILIDSRDQRSLLTPLERLEEEGRGDAFALADPNQALRGLNGTPGEFLPNLYLEVDLAEQAEKEFKVQLEIARRLRRRAARQKKS